MNLSKTPSLASSAATKGRGAQQAPSPPVANSAEASIGTRILSSLKGQIEPIPVSVFYVLAMFPVAVLMLVLPLVYMTLVGAVVGGLYWHAVNNVTLFQSIPSVVGAAICYATPLIAGIVLLFFMIKPFFARRGMGDRPFIVRREDEPLLYQFVDQLCDMLHARRPSYIEIDCQVNAGAGFKGIAGLLTGRVILVIGLPLVAGMNLDQFTGVLAHELGHFTQRSGMRLSFIIRTVNMWFARVVLQRDKWDFALLRASHSRTVRIRFFALISRFLIWITRRILYFLLWIAALFSAILTRRQEYDADTYEARVAGADVFEQTTRRLQALVPAFQFAYRELGTAWRERRLADDLPMLVCTREAEFTPEIRAKISEAFLNAKTGRFSTHPCDRDRIAAVRRLNPKPVFSFDAPAAALFTDFKELCRMSSIKFYQQILGKNLKAEHLYTTENMLDLHQARRENFTALQRYFQNLIAPQRPLNIFSAAPIPASPESRAAIMMEARTKLCAAAEQGAADAKAFVEAAVILDRVTRVRALIEAQIKFDPAKFSLQSASPVELANLENQATVVRKQALEALDEILAPQARRVQAALACVTVPKEAPADETYDLDETTAGTDVIVEALRAITLCRGQIETLRNQTRKFAALLACARPAGNPAPYVAEVVSTSKVVTRELGDIHSQLRRIPYPYQHTERGVSLSRFCCALLPPQNKFRPLCTAAQNTLSGLDSLYMRLMSDVAQKAEQAESTMGLAPLPEPKGQPSRLGV